MHRFEEDFCSINCTSSGRESSTASVDLSSSVAYLVGEASWLSRVDSPWPVFQDLSVPF